jgi:D-glycero-D-manno-heptose 1,7-bisphosphate phosphatase
LNLKLKRTPFALWLRPGRHNRGRGKLALLDRDGLLIADTGYPHHADHLHLLPSGIALCRHWQQQGYALVIVSNQSGIARGMFTAEEYARFTQAMLTAFAQKGIYFRAVLACPHHRHAAVPAWRRPLCLCRKPRPGLAAKAMRILGMPAQSCLLAGDRPRDLIPGRRLGIPRRHLVPTTLRTNGRPHRPWRERSLALAAMRG